MNRIALALWALVAPVPAIAADWVLSQSTPSGQTFIDQASISRTGDMVRVWEKLVPPKGAPFEYAAFLIEYDCAEKKGRLLQKTLVFRDGEALTANKPEDWTYPVPDTSAAVHLDLVCGDKP